MLLLLLLHHCCIVVALLLHHRCIVVVVDQCVLLPDGVLLSGSCGKLQLMCLKLVSWNACVAAAVEQTGSEGSWQSLFQAQALLHHKVRMMY